MHHNHTPCTPHPAPNKKINKLTTQQLNNYTTPSLRNFITYTAHRFHRLTRIMHHNHTPCTPHPAPNKQINNYTTSSLRNLITYTAHRFPQTMRLAPCIPHLKINSLPSPLLHSITPPLNHSSLNHSSLYCPVLRQQCFPDDLLFIPAGNEVAGVGSQMLMQRWVARQVRHSAL